MIYLTNGTPQTLVAPERGDARRAEGFTKFAQCWSAMVN